MKRFDLPCLDGHKSFYGKAIVEELPEKHEIRLYSYGVHVASIAMGTIHKTYDGYSRTTLRHVNSFCKFYLRPTISKKEWEDMPIIFANVKEQSNL